MPIWLPITLAAALFQTWRTAKQQKLRHLLSVNGAGFVRFLYGVPVGFVLLAGGLALTGQSLPAPSGRFVAYCAAGGLLQIVATNLLIMAFGFRNFAVGTAYAKTEAAQSALIAWVVLGEALRALTLVGIGIGLVGVMVLSLAGRDVSPREVVSAVTQPAAKCGLAAGLLFAFTTVFIKLANQSVARGATDTPTLLVCALFALLVTNTLQTLMQGTWIAWREPAELRRAVTTWRSSAIVGALSASGSACWFTAFAMAPVALVRSVGQVEMVFTLLFSRFYLKETLRRADVLGLVLVVTGVLVIILAR